jgi:hypothetical protein
MTVIAKNLTTHVALILDRSVSMRHLEKKTIQVADALVKFLAEQSSDADKKEEITQEWRVSIYTFGNEPDCHIWDMDVLRLPSMERHYRIDGNTALIDAMDMALDDAEKIPTHRGDHAFLYFLVTDGEENWSMGGKPRGSWYQPPVTLTQELAARLRDRLGALSVKHTVSVFAPNSQGVAYSQNLGFDNIYLWDATTEAGMEAASQAMQTSAKTYMEARKRGDEGLRSMRKGGLFVGANVDAQAIKDAKLTPLPTEDRRIVMVTKTKSNESLFFEKPINRPTKSRPVPDKAWHIEIQPFVDGAYPPFRVGMAYYELIKSEKVGADKRIAVVEINTQQVYVGAGARKLLGLPNGECRVKPTLNPDYQIFVESTSLNRHLRLGTKLLLLTK